MPIKTWKQFGFGVGSKAAGNAINLGTGAINSLINYHLNEKAANNADKRQRAMYNDLYSPAARLQQYRDAGISPSLAFTQGGAGAGGASAPQGAGAAGPSVAGGNLDPISKAQMDLLNEETRGKKIENDNKQALIDTDIALKLSQMGLNKASQAYTETQDMRANIAARIEGATEGIQIDKIINEAEYMFWESYKCQYEAKGEQTEYEFDLETYETRVKIVAAEYTKILTDIREGESRIKLNQATINNMAQQIAINWYNAKVGYMNALTQKKWFNDQIKVQLQTLKQNKEITQEQLELMSRGQWINLGTDIFGSVCNIGAAGCRTMLKP